MKLRSAMIAYNPGSSEVEVGPWPDKTGWSRPYRFTLGACFSERRELACDRQIAMMFVDFHHIVVRDSIEPQAAHEAFLHIDEYAAVIASDIHGANLGLPSPWESTSADADQNEEE